MDAEVPSYASASSCSCSFDSLPRSSVDAPRSRIVSFSLPRPLAPTFFSRIAVTVPSRLLPHLSKASALSLEDLAESPIASLMPLRLLVVSSTWSFSSAISLSTCSVAMRWRSSALVESANLAASCVSASWMRSFLWTTASA